MTQIRLASEMDRLEARFKVMQRDGLLDFQFTVDPRGPTSTVEQLAAELNECLDAIDRGEYDDLVPLGDSHRP